MIVVAPDRLELSEAWIEGEDGARWRSASAHGAGVGAAASGSSLLEVEPGCHLPRHVDSAEEAIVVIAGRALAIVGDERAELGAGEAAVVPRELPHEVHNAGDDTLRFLALYAAPEVVTTYEQPVQPAGERERKSTA